MGSYPLLSQALTQVEVELGCDKKVRKKTYCKYEKKGISILSMVGTAPKPEPRFVKIWNVCQNHKEETMICETDTNLFDATCSVKSLLSYDRLQRIHTYMMQ